MPQVKSYQGLQVDRAGLPNARITATPTPGAGISQLGAVGAKLGGAILQDQAQQMEVERERADEIAVLTARNGYDQIENDALYNPKTGALMTQGANAFGVTDPTMQALDKAASDIEARLTTPRQKLLWTRFRAGRTASVRESLDRHVASESQKHDTQETEKAIANAQQRAVRAADDVNDPSWALKVHAALTEAEDAAAAFTKRTGMGDEAAEDATRRVRTSTYEAVITNLLTKNPTAAKEFFTAVRDQIDISRLDDIEKMVKAGTLDHQGEQLASQVWQKLGPTEDTDAISLDKMEDELRTLTGDNNDLFKAARTALRNRKTAVDDGRKERADQTNDAVWGAVYNGANERQLQQMPEFVRNPKLQIEVRRYLESRQEHFASLANQASSRAAAEESRAYTRFMRQQNLLEFNGKTEVYRYLSDPKLLGEISTGDIYKKLPQIGPDNVGILLNAKASLSKGADAIKNISIDHETFVSIAKQNGIDYAAAPKDETQKATLATLEARVKQRMANMGQVDFQTQRKVIEDVLSERFIVEGKFRETEIIGALLDPEDADKVRVPMNVVRRDPTALKALVNRLRANDATLVNKSDEQIIALRTRQLERAYAAGVLRLPESEGNRRLGIR